MLEIVVKHCTSYQDFLYISKGGLQLLPPLTDAAGGIYLDLLLLAAGLNICNGFLTGSELTETLSGVS